MDVIIITKYEYESSITSGYKKLLINKLIKAITTKKTDKIWFLLYLSFKKIIPKNTLKIGNI